ncbi:MAG TPA: MlaD family protein [Bacteroidia bacterium]|nr:MlaD family protein [Bacteroidia bacterium]
MKISKEAKTGVVVVAALAMLIYGLNFLKGINIFSHTKKLYAVYDHVEGLLPSSPVLVNGFHIGQVDELKLEPNSSGKVLISMIITNNDIQIPKTSVARITSDFFGNKAIQIEIPKDTVTGKLKDALIIKDKDTLTAANEITLKDQVSAQVLPLKNKAEELMSTIDSTMNIIKGVFTKKTQNNLSQSIESINISLKHFESMSGNLDDLVTTQKQRIGDIFGKIDEISTDLAKNSKQLGNAINNIANITDTLAKSKLKDAVNNADSTLYYTAQIFKKVNSGKGTLGMLANDTTLYNRLSGTSLQLNLLLQDMKAHPNRYVHFSLFGSNN